MRHPKMRVMYTPSILLFLLIQSSMLSTSRAPTKRNLFVRPKKAVCNIDKDGQYQCGYGSDSSILQAPSSMRYDTNLTSEEGSFTVGFFVLGNSTYLGTWYGNFSNEPVIVWVANRENPINSSLLHNCSLVLGNDGKVAIVSDSHKNPHTYWSTHPSSGSNIYLQILDNGNLVLADRGSLAYLWQSFEHPTDTFLVGMEFGNSVNLISWKSPEDPSEGDYVLKRGEGDKSNYLSMYNSSQSSTPYWESSFSGLPPNLVSLLSSNFTRISTTRRLVMNSTGSVQLWELDQDGKNWSMTWAAPKDQCDLYDPCGSFGVCDAGNGFRCKCLPGYQPSDPQKWESKDFSSGCTKKTNDPCGDMFLRLPMVKLPPSPNIDFYPKNEAECKDTCLNGCGKLAYSFDHNQSRCLIWTEGLSNIEEEYYNADANMLNIRLNHSDLDLGSRICSICGTNVIPYPLSSNSSCGDPNYHKFECNMKNGQVYFKPPSGKAYKISLIDHIHRKFTLQLLSTANCVSNDIIESKEFNLDNASQFKVTRCAIVPLTERPTIVEVEVSWINPTYPPACNSTADCKDWIETNCGLDKDYGKKVCLCAKGFHWDSLSMNCTKGHHKHTSLWIKVGITSGSVLFLLCGLTLLIHFQRRATTTAGTGVQFKDDDIEEIDIPFVDYQSIVAATGNFSDANKLGAGGFGPVYKGILADGNEVAVKRLSTTSVQGAQEFRNEIIVIAKLQHRNLVRVLGYCISEDEKILIYEYMPNKSLDSSLFDQSVSPSLDWMKRTNIILGIARGLLYLHEDSRLRIIHRDLKPSNILLDEGLNPKISDFGLAKIVAGNDMATNTARVVGTYGYMSPEYALEGYFSTKSDVYSFGIIVFEVISGKRCTSLLPLENKLANLLGYAWDLWKQGKELELVDKSIIETGDDLQFKRFINVALLCVQGNPSDRPTMSSALLMLSSDNMNLPCPKEPVFIARRQQLATSSSSKFGSSTGSRAELTTTTLEAR